MTVREFLNSYLRANQDYPTLTEIREGVGTPETQEDIDFLAHATEMSDDHSKNAQYQIQAYLIYQIEVDVIMDLYLNKPYHDYSPYGE